MKCVSNISQQPYIYRVLSRFGTEFERTFRNKKYITNTIISMDRLSTRLDRTKDKIRNWKLDMKKLHWIQHREDRKMDIWSRIEKQRRYLIRRTKKKIKRIKKGCSQGNNIWGLFIVQMYSCSRWNKALANFSYLWRYLIRS